METKKCLKNIFLLKKQKISQEFPVKLLGDGIKMVRSVLLKIHPEQECMINRIYLGILVGIIILRKKGKLLIVESLPKNKVMILSDKKIFTETNSLITSWLQTSVQELIGTVKVLKPFWNKQCLENSKKLWLPIEIDCADSLSNSSNLFCKQMVSNSLYSTETILPKINRQDNHPTQNSHKIFSPLSTSIPVDKWEKEDTVLRTRRLRVYPTQEQRKIWKEWINTSRYVYNKGLEGITKNKEKINFYDLRNKYVTQKHRGTEEKNENVQDWEINTPKDVRAGSLRDLTKAYKTAFSSLKNGSISKFNLNYRSKKNGYQSIEIPKTTLSCTGKKEIEMFKRYNLGSVKISNELNRIKKKKKSKRQFPRKLNFEYDCRLKVDQYNQWFLIIPENVIKRKSPNNEKCALDPGSRKFQTIYSPLEARKIPVNKELVRNIRKKIAIYQQLRHSKSIKKSTMSRGIRKTWKRYINLLDDMHFQTCNYLTKNYKEIFLPQFESQEMVKKLNSTTRFNILNLQHYTFKERLRSKCEQRMCTLTDCTEEYTSKTCTRCGTITNVGSSEIYNCSSCKLEIDRDVNGSRNIYLKCIS
jgi:putative transposase